MSLRAHILIFRCHRFDRRDAQPAWVTIHLLITNTGRLSTNPITGHVQMSYIKHIANGALSILGVSQERRGIQWCGTQGRDGTPTLCCPHTHPKEQRLRAASKPPFFLSPAIIYGFTLLAAPLRGTFPARRCLATAQTWGLACQTPSPEPSFNNINYLWLSITKKKISWPHWLPIAGKRAEEEAFIFTSQRRASCLITRGGFFFPLCTFWTL